MQPLLPDIEALTLRVFISSRGSGTLPGFLHSTLRGAFGHALRRIAGQDDDMRSSPYARIFDGVPYPNRGGDLHTSVRRSPPPPYLIRTDTQGSVAKPEPRKIRRGTTLAFQMTLFGFACDELKAVALALDNAAAEGLGTDKIPFELDSILCASTKGPVELNLAAPARPEGPSLAMLATASLPPPWCVSTLTPLQLRSRGELIASPGGDQFLRAIYRRLLTLELAVGGSVREKPPQVPRKAAMEWRGLDKVRIERKSARQNRRITLSGIHGQAEVTAEPKDVALALLLAGAVVGVGHGTTQGHGQFMVKGAEALLSCYGLTP